MNVQSFFFIISFSFVHGWKSTLWWMYVKFNCSVLINKYVSFYNHFPQVLFIFISEHGLEKHPFNNSGVPKLHLFKNLSTVLKAPFPCWPRTQDLCWYVCVCISWLRHQADYGKGHGDRENVLTHLTDSYKHSFACLLVFLRPLLGHSLYLFPSLGRYMTQDTQGRNVFTPKVFFRQHRVVTGWDV